jgi:hypothetical protein
MASSSAPSMRLPRLRRRSGEPAMEQVHSPDAAHEIASLRERLRAWRGQGTGIPSQSALAASKQRPDGHAAQADEPDTVWGDTQWTDTVFGWEDH